MKKLIVLTLFLGACAKQKESTTTVTPQPIEIEVIKEVEVQSKVEITKQSDAVLVKIGESSILVMAQKEKGKCTLEVFE